MNIYEKNSDIYIEKPDYFNIEQTFTCGQCFRFKEIGPGRFSGVAFGKYLSISQSGDGIVIHGCTIDEFNKIWKNFFDTDTDYKEISSSVLKDEIMNSAVNYGNGIRILNQDTFECLISFIISQNNSIPNIQRVVERISENYGDFIGVFDGEKRYSFPTPSQLSRASVSDLAELKCGYRAEYIHGFVKEITEGNFDIREPFDMDTKSAREKLMSFKGIGGKVADCALLFAYHKFDVFPTDVWVKKAMKDLYNTDVKDIDRFSMEYFGKNRGLAQQYLFYYKRSGD